MRSRCVNVKGGAVNQRRHPGARSLVMRNVRSGSLQKRLNGRHQMWMKSKSSGSNGEKKC